MLNHATTDQETTTMTKLIVATVQGNDRDGYRLNPVFNEYEDMTVAEWKAICAADGVTVTENADLVLDAPVKQGAVYHCAVPPDAQGVVYHSMDVCVWEEAD